MTSVTNNTNINKYNISISIDKYSKIYKVQLVEMLNDWQGIPIKEYRYNRYEKAYNKYNKLVDDCMYITSTQVSQRIHEYYESKN